MLYIAATYVYEYIVYIYIYRQRALCTLLYAERHHSSSIPVAPFANEARWRCNFWGYHWAAGSLGRLWLHHCWRCRVLLGFGCMCMRVVLLWLGGWWWLCWMVACGGPVIRPFTVSGACIVCWNVRSDGFVLVLFKTLASLYLLCGDGEQCWWRMMTTLMMASWLDAGACVSMFTPNSPVDVVVVVLILVVVYAVIVVGRIDIFSHTHARNHPSTPIPPNCVYHSRYTIHPTNCASQPSQARVPANGTLARSGIKSLCRRIFLAIKIDRRSLRLIHTSTCISIFNVRNRTHT